jgi:putative hydrolase
MSNFGFGFGPPGDENNPVNPFGFGGSNPANPFGLGGDDLSAKIPLFAELQKLMSGASGPVNWDLARQLAISTLAGQHHAVSATDQSEVADALRLADLWLDSVTDLASGVSTTHAWSQVQWVENTIGTWSALCDPVANRVVGAMSAALPPEIAAQAGPMAPMMTQLGGLMFGAQLGQGLAQLAAEVVSATDVGLPLGPVGTAALVPANIAAFASGLGHSVSDVRLFIAVREAAYQRLYAHVPWLRQQLLEAVDAYGRGIHIDPDAISSALSDIDPTNPESMQNALAGGLFQPANTDAQNLALKRLATLLALIEGWVDTVTVRATESRMASATPLAEAIRRRRATGGPAEQTFATLVGLELRPRQLREAALLWAGMTDSHGTAARESLWNHPDLLPTATDLENPTDFVQRYGSASISEQELNTLLDGPAIDPPAQPDPPVEPDS